MPAFILRRIGVMLLTALALTFIVFSLTNLEPNLRKLAKSEGSVRMEEPEVQSWLEENGFKSSMLRRSGAYPTTTRVTASPSLSTERALRGAGSSINRSGM